MTAEELLARLHELGLNPVANGTDLSLSSPPPADLDPIIDILVVPVVGLLTGRTIYAFDSGGRPFPGGGVINPRLPLPHDVRLICVEGGEWDRISPFARQSYPRLFSPHTAAKTKKPSAKKWERAK